MSKDGKMKVHLFDGQGYSLWKKRILLYLKWKKCAEPATRARLSTESAEDWDE